MNLNALEQAIRGQVFRRDSPARAGLSKPYNALFDDLQPQATVLCASPDDVMQTVAFIRQHRLESAIRSGGHCFAGRSSTHGILIDVAPMNSVTVADGIARVGAGARLGEVYEGLLAHNATIPAGSCPSVGIAGLTLGGGLGYLGRMYGLTSDQLIGVDIVLADGRLIACSKETLTDLFWALRGGGNGQFGVVTELRFRTVPVPRVTTSFHMTWPFAQGASVAQAWLGWAPSAPDEIAASLDVRAGANPDEAPQIELFGTMIGGRSDAEVLLAELVGRANGDPADSDVEELSYRDMLRHWAEHSRTSLEDPRARTVSRPFEFIKSEFFNRPLAPESLAALLANLVDEAADDLYREVDFSPWGGAYNRTAPEVTAFPHRNSSYWLKHTARIDQPTSTAEHEARQWVKRSWAAVHGDGTGRVFPNFADPELEDWGSAYYGSNYRHLVELKRRYDPDNLFRFRQSLPVR